MAATKKTTKASTAKKAPVKKKTVAKKTTAKKTSKKEAAVLIEDTPKEKSQAEILLELTAERDKNNTRKIAVKKPRKKRKPMSAEQKAAAAERLRKAREARQKENPPEYKSIHPDVVALPEDATLSMGNVKEWIKSNQVKLSAEKRNVRNSIKGAERKVAELTNYISAMQNYLRTSVWNDLFYGEHRDNRIKYFCYAPSFDKDGNIKRSVGTFYKDIGEEWTQEMDERERVRDDK